MERMTFFGISDVGKVRSNNEDAYIVQKIWDENHLLAVVIEGGGGDEGGEIASALAKRTLVEYLEKYPNGERSELLKQAVVYANNMVYTERKKSNLYGNMSCVLTAILIEIQNGRVNMAHVGDTRLYQYFHGTLTKLSHDHSLVGYKEEIGELTEEEAMHHPQRNVIGRDVGSTYLETENNEYVEIATFPLLSKSTLLLCSDGLCDMVTSSRMCDVLNRNISLKDKAVALIDAANDAGGKDNVTVVLVESNLEMKSQKPDEVVHLSNEAQNIEVEHKRNTTSDASHIKRMRVKWIASIVFAFVLGGIAGELLSLKKCPQVLPDKSQGVNAMSDMANDAVIMQLRNDTAMLHRQIKKKDVEIQALFDQLTEHD